MVEHVLLSPGGATEVTLAAALADLDAIVTRLAATLSIAGVVAVSNFPASVEVANDAGNPLPVLGPLTDTQLRAAAVAITAAYLANQAGTWGYKAGVSGTPSITGKVIGIAAHATTAASFTINGGDAIPVPANSSIAIQPLGNLVSPTIVFTGTDSYFVEVLT